MLDTPIDSNVASDLVAVGRFASDRGWVPATSGNFSARLDARTCAITRSGTDKGRLTEADITSIAIDEPLPPGVSAEAPLHIERYRASPYVGAVLHVHTVAATAISRADADRGSAVLEGFEMHKALAGYDTHESTVDIPIFANEQDVAALARRVHERLSGNSSVPGYLLAGHGLYAWGANLREAQRHLEALVFLLECDLEERKIR